MQRTMFSPTDDDTLKDRAVGFPNSSNKTSSISINQSANCNDGKSKLIFKCKYNKCALRDNGSFAPADIIVSTSTNRMYSVITPPGTTYILY